MLPILKKKVAPPPAPLVVQERASQQQIEPSEPGISVTEAIESCARHLLLAIEARDVKAMAEALNDAHDVMHSYMDRENEPKAEPHSYAAQNALAGK